MFGQVQHLKLCQFACLCFLSLRARAWNTPFLSPVRRRIFFGKHDRLSYLVIQVASINTFQSTIANFALKARKNCFPLSQ